MCSSAPASSNRHRGPEAKDLRGASTWNLGGKVNFSSQSYRRLMCLHTMKKWRIRSHIASDSTLSFTKCLHLLCHALPHFLIFFRSRRRNHVWKSLHHHRLKKHWQIHVGKENFRYKLLDTKPPVAADPNGTRSLPGMEVCKQWHCQIAIQLGINVVSHLFCAWKMQLHWEGYAVPQEATWVQGGRKLGGREAE